MNSKPAARQALRPALILGVALGALAMPVLPAIAADAAADQEWRLRELEEQARQEDARRQMEERERSQQEALRAQEQAIRRLEERQRQAGTASQGISPPAARPLAAPLLAAAAADPSAAEQERRIRELEERVRQEDARRDIEQRERSAQEALRGQEDAIRRLEEARRRLEANSREVAELSSELGRNYAWSFSTAEAPPRALLGVSIDSTASRRDGALVRDVSPGGAAAEAGIQPGDVIVSLDGQLLNKDGDPGRALVEQMRTVAPDTKLKVVVMRDGKRMSFDVTARAAPQVRAFGAPDVRIGQLQERMEDLGERFRRQGNVLIAPGTAGEPGAPQILELFGGNTRYGGMEFATLSERLGSYFGVKEGVLVVRAGADAPFGLQDGDVILSIDGRTPGNAQHVGRILRSYQPGEKVKLRVQRERKAIELESTVPGQR